MNTSNSDAVRHDSAAPLGNLRNTLPVVNADDKIERYRLQATARELLPEHRVQICLRRRASLDKPVRVMFGKQWRKAYYSNVMRCGSVWACPVCAGKITRERAARLVAALQDVDEPFLVPSPDGVRMEITPLRYHVFMATYTISHRAHSTLAYVATRLLDSYKRMWSGRWAVSCKERYNILGMVKALEVTYGASGWHPHLHVLIVIDGALPDKIAGELDLELFKQWDNAVVSQGGYINEHGFDIVRADHQKIVYSVEGGTQVTEALDKYGGVNEVARYPTKLARGDNRSLMQLLQDAANGDGQAGYRWTEAQAFLEGKRQLRTSPAIQALIDDKFDIDDDEKMTVAEIRDDDMILASLTTDEWTAIVQSGCRGGVLEIANTGDVIALREYIDSIWKEWARFRPLNIK